MINGIKSIYHQRTIIQRLASALLMPAHCRCSQSRVPGMLLHGTLICALGFRSSEPFCVRMLGFSADPPYLAPAQQMTHLPSSRLQRSPTLFWLCRLCLLVSCNLDLLALAHHGDFARPWRELHGRVRESALRQSWGNRQIGEDHCSCRRNSSVFSK